MYALLLLFSRLPLWVLHRLADGLAFVVDKILSYRKEVILQNLRKSFPDKSEQELKQIKTKFYQQLADVVVEAIKAMSISEKELRRRVQYKNPELIAEAFKNHNTVLIMTSHQANWEWILLGGKLHTDYPVHGVYQRLSNDFSERVMQRIRGRFDTPPLLKEKLGRTAVRNRQSKNAYALVADQTPRQNEPKLWFNFLNQDTAFLTGTERLAQLLQAPVFFVEMQRLKRGYYEIVVSPMISPPYQKDKELHITEDFARRAEESIHKNPSDWLWSHRRWKLVRD